MLPTEIRDLFDEAVLHRKREHRTERDDAIRAFTFKMGKQGIPRSSAFNNGTVKVYCEAFEKFATSIWNDMQRVMAGGFEFYPRCEVDVNSFLTLAVTPVQEADKQKLFAPKKVVADPITARHLAQCQPQFEFRYQAIIEKLTTEIKIFSNRLRAIRETAPVPAAGEIRPQVNTAIPKQTRSIKKHQPKPVARFENDYGIAIIPGKKGIERRLTIERELQSFIKTIIAAGGSLSRLKLREGKPENYRPEKMLDSKNAKVILRKGLIRKERSGRTTTYWVCCRQADT